MKLEELFSYRRSTRMYKNQQITEEQLQQILAAAQNAPLAVGNRPKARLTVVQNPELLDEIRKCCQTESRKSPGVIRDSLYGAPTLILVSESILSEDRIELCDAACIIENMMLEATSLGLGCCYIWGCLSKLRANSVLLEKLELAKEQVILSGFICGTPVKPLYAKEREPISVRRL
ncbi:MAG: nitroreductase family protein [Clostridiales bacterium]|nr:nitroreductase family protein [Clostridiales bacterium]